MLWLWLAWGPGSRTVPGRPHPLRCNPGPRTSRQFDALQTAKGLCVAGALLLIFLFTDWPRDVAALVGAGVLLLSRRLHSAHVMGFVDWQLLLLFIGLFVVNHAFESTGLAAEAVAWLAAQGVHLAEPGPLLVAGRGAVQPGVQRAGGDAAAAAPAGRRQAGMMLALVSTLAGNLLLVGSIANLIVVDLARRAASTSTGSSMPPSASR